MTVEKMLYKGNKKADILLEMGFKPFDIHTIKLYESYLKQMNGPTGSYMRISNIICWSFYTIPYYIEKNGFILIINDDAYYKTFSVLMPIGNYENKEGLKSCFSFIDSVYAKLGIPYEYIQGKEWMKAYLKDFTIQYSYIESESDYLYSLNELDKSIQRRKIHYDHKVIPFIEKYQPNIREYTPIDKKACIKLIKECHCEEEGCNTCIFGCVLKWFDILVNHSKELNAKIYIIESKGTILGFVTMVMDEDLLYFDRKAPHLYEGLSEYINQFIVSNWKDTYSIMNYEEDMGSEGLRRFKRALGPYTLSINYRVKVMLEREEYE
ncbi:MAG: hypothetical protein HUJ53_08340 [Holdemanella sp.]|nr:hypothetical protein [Holdemanella sp.]